MPAYESEPLTRPAGKAPVEDDEQQGRPPVPGPSAGEMARRAEKEKSTLQRLRRTRLTWVPDQIEPLVRHLLVIIVAAFMVVRRFAVLAFPVLVWLASKYLNW